MRSYFGQQCCVKIVSSILCFKIEGSHPSEGAVEHTHTEGSHPSEGAVEHTHTEGSHPSEGVVEHTHRRLPFLGRSRRTHTHTQTDEVIRFDSKSVLNY